MKPIQKISSGKTDPEAQRILQAVQGSIFFAFSETVYGKQTLRW
jgi:hypothetical protein